MLGLHPCQTEGCMGLHCVQIKNKSDTSTMKLTTFQPIKEDYFRTTQDTATLEWSGTSRVCQEFLNWTVPVVLRKLYGFLCVQMLFNQFQEPNLPDAPDDITLVKMVETY